MTHLFFLCNCSNLILTYFLQFQEFWNINSERGGYMETKRKLTLSDKIKNITTDRIYKIMNSITLIVSSIFLIKNLLGGTLAGTLSIGICLGLYCIILFSMTKLDVPTNTRNLVVSIALLVVISIISIFSGDSYSDDFLLYLSAMGMSGLFLNPKYPQVQLPVADALLVIQCILAPQKMGAFSQFIMCVVLFNLAGTLLMLIVARGHAFIVDSNAHAKEMEKVLDQLSIINAQLTQNFQDTQGRIHDITHANQQVEVCTGELLTASTKITSNLTSTISTCDDASKLFALCNEQINALLEHLHHFEQTIKENEGNISVMSSGIITIKDSANATTVVFDGIQKQMEEIVKVVEQLKSIASNTNMLSLNASIEAARAGSAGAGFAVVAEKVQQLAVDSNACSNHVAQIVSDMGVQVEKTRQQMQKSTENVDSSLASIDALNKGFEELLNNFTSLYKNIAEHDTSVSRLSENFNDIHTSVSDMVAYSEENQASVVNIADSIKVYGTNVKQMGDDTETIRQLVVSMEKEISNQ